MTGTDILFVIFLVLINFLAIGAGYIRGHQDGFNRGLEEGVRIGKETYGNKQYL